MLSQPSGPIFFLPYFSYFYLVLRLIGEYNDVSVRQNIAYHGIAIVWSYLSTFLP